MLHQRTATVDDVLDRTGPWHYPVLILNAFGGFASAWHIMALQFMAPNDVQYWCARPNTSVTVEQWKILNNGIDIKCFIKGDDGVPVKCTSWEYDHSFHTKTLTEEWDAVCGREWLCRSSQSLLMVGMIGGLVFHQLSDWYGRRRTLLVTNALQVIIGISAAFTSTFWTFSIFRMFLLSVSLNFTTLALECVGPSKRALVSMSGSVSWFIGLMTLPIITYNVRDWRLIQLIISIPALVWLIWLLYLDESPKWLASAGRFEETERLLSKIIARNNLYHIDVNVVMKEAQLIIETECSTNRHGTPLDLFKGFLIGKTTLFFIFNDITAVFIYYFLLYYTVDIGGSPYLNLIFTAISEAPISTICFFVIKYAHRKPVYSITYSLVIASLSMLLLLPRSTCAAMTLALMAKLAGQITWSLIQVHVSEVYPTRVRALAGSFVQAVARLGAITAPLLSALNGTSDAWISVVVTIILCIVSWAAAMALPETFNTTLPDTFHDTLTLLEKDKRKNKSRNQEMGI